MWVRVTTKVYISLYYTKRLRQWLWWAKNRNTYLPGGNVTAGSWARNPFADCVTRVPIYFLPFLRLFCIFPYILVIFVYIHILYTPNRGAIIVWPTRVSDTRQHYCIPTIDTHYNISLPRHKNTHNDRFYSLNISIFLLEFIQVIKTASMQGKLSKFFSRKTFNIIQRLPRLKYLSNFYV